MIQYDQKDKQILSTACMNCSDPYFSEKGEGIPNVGCCNYSPVFTLFEIAKMIAANQEDFFKQQLFHNPSHTVRAYEMTIHATVDPSYVSKDDTGLSDIEKEDQRLSYSVCQFFREGKGCTLKPEFKTSVCRSFICPTIEEKIDDQTIEQVQHWVKAIRTEVQEFNRIHQQLFKQKGWNLRDHAEEIIDYFQVQAEAELFKSGVIR